MKVSELIENLKIDSRYKEGFVQALKFVIIESDVSLIDGNVNELINYINLKDKESRKHYEC